MSNQCIERALNLYGKLFALLQTHGFSIEIKEADNSKAITCLKRDGEEIHVHIEEKLKNVPYILTAEDKKKLAQKELRTDDWFLRSWEPPKWDYEVSGDLQFKIDNMQYSGLRQNWSDGKRNKLEELLPSIAHYIIKSAEYLRNRTLEREERKRQWAEESRLREEQKRQQLEEQKRVEHLDKLLGDWNKRENLLKFLAWLSANMPATECTEEYNAWHEWCQNYAEKLNPLSTKDFYKQKEPEWRF